MSLPLPPEEAVVAVFAARHYDGLTYSDIVRWARGEPVKEASDAWHWGPISRGTAHAWYRQALQWWLVHERLTPDEEFAALRVGYDLAASELVRAYRRDDIKVKEFVELTAKLGKAIAELTGLERRADDPAPTVSVSPRAQAAIDEMAQRRAERGRKGIGA